MEQSCNPESQVLFNLFGEWTKPLGENNLTSEVEQTKVFFFYYFVRPLSAKYM